MVLQATDNSTNGTNPGVKMLVVGDNLRNPGKPEAADINDLLKEKKEYFRAFHQQCREEEDYYFLRRTVPTPANVSMDPVKPATAKSIVNIATDHVDITNPEVFVPDPSPRSKDRAERLQTFLQGAWMHIPDLVKRTAVQQSFIYGISFLKNMWDTDKWPDAPRDTEFEDDQEFRKAIGDYMKIRNISFPMAVINVNPKNMVWDDSRAAMKWVIEFYELPSKLLKGLYPEWQPLKGPGTMVSFLEYWDDTWHGRMIDGEWVWGPFEHGYGFMPYTPDIPGASLDWDVGLPEERYQGILKPIHNLLDAEARLVTQYESILRQYAWRALDFKGNAVSAQNAADKYEMSPGTKNIIPQGVTVEPSPLVMPPQELLSQLSIVQTMIEEATFPNVVRGMRPTGISSGFGVSVLSGMGRMVFGRYAGSMARTMEQINVKFLKLVENKAMGKVTVRARSVIKSFDQTIGPDDIRGFYENSVALKAESPEEREREAVLAERLFKSGIISLYTAMRRSGITNPLEEQTQIAAEQIAFGLRPNQIERAIASFNLPQQLESAASNTLSGNTGNQFSPGLSQLQRPGEANLQRARVASQQGQTSVFPQGQGGINLLGGMFGGATGGGGRVPSGQTVR